MPVTGIREMTRAVPTAASGEVDRGGSEPVPARLGHVYQFGNSAACFEKIRNYSRMRMALFLSKRHRRSRELGWSVITYQSQNHELGLVTLCGNRRQHPGPTGTGGESRMPAVNGVGKPCAGEPHHSLTGGGWKRSNLATVTAVKRPAGESRENKST